MLKKIILGAALLASTSFATYSYFPVPEAMHGDAKLVADFDMQDKYKDLQLTLKGRFVPVQNLELTLSLPYMVFTKWDGEDTNGDGMITADDKTNLEYLNIPVLANYYIIPGLAIKAGIQPGFLTKAKHGDLDIKENCKKLDISIPLGLSYDISDFVIDARYNLGVSNVNDLEHSPSQKNGVIMLTVGYKIPL